MTTHAFGYVPKIILIIKLRHSHFDCFDQRSVPFCFFLNICWHKKKKKCEYFIQSLISFQNLYENKNRTFFELKLTWTLYAVAEFFRVRSDFSKIDRPTTTLHSHCNKKNEWIRFVNFQFLKKKFCLFLSKMCIPFVS